MTIVRTPLGDGRFRLGDAHGDLVDEEPVTQADVEARERALEKRRKASEDCRAAYRKKERPNATGPLVSAAPAKDAIDMLRERGFTIEEIALHSGVAPKRVYEVMAGRQKRVRQGTFDALVDTVVDAVNGTITPKGGAK